MPDRSFNEAEQFLLKKWEKTLEVEESIEQVRIKYQSLCEQIVDEIRENHQELDIGIAEVTRISGTSKKSGVIILGQRNWPSAGKNYPSGFWFENLRLDVLADTEDDEPALGFWLHWSDEKDDPIFAPVENEIVDAARKSLTSDQLTRMKFGDNENSALIGVKAPTKRELLEMLASNETEKFAEAISESLEGLCSLIDCINKAMAKLPKK